jgi:outer membrane protein insertion porin family
MRHVAWLALLWACPVFTQQSAPPEAKFPPAETSRQEQLPRGVVREIEFTGLRRVSAGTLRQRVALRPGDELNPDALARDVRALERTGWFDAVSVEVTELPVLLAAREVFGEPAALPAMPLLRATFVLAERPFLERVDFRGSRLLTRARIAAVLEAEKVALRTATFLHPAELWRAKRALQAALAERGYPLATVRVRVQPTRTHSARVTFEMDDGPRVAVSRLRFTGNEQHDDSELRREMRRLRPGALLAAWREQDVYTRQRLESDLERIAAFYRNRGGLEARLGAPQVTLVEQPARRWLPWPRKVQGLFYEIEIPVVEGPVYRLAEVHLRGAESFERTAEAGRVLQSFTAGEVFSEQKIEQARSELARLLREKDEPRPLVETEIEKDAAARTVRVFFRVRPAPRYTVRRLDISGHHRLPLSFYLRRIGLREGEFFDAEKLERGLLRLSAHGFVRPPRAEDLRVTLDGASRSAEVFLRVEELGRQRITWSGGRNPFGSALGISYTIFNLLRMEEWLSAQLEAAPDSVHVLLGVARDSVFGTPATLGVSLFRHVVEPRLLTSFGRQPLFSSRSQGLGMAWTQPASARDQFAVRYDVSRSVTDNNWLSLVGAPGGNARSTQRRSALGTTWSRTQPRAAADASMAFAGGWLGGDERWFKASLTAARLLGDPFTNGRNTWAFRGHAAGVRSLGGPLLPFTSRFYPGDELVRGARTNGLTPYLVASGTGAEGTETSRAIAGGANAVAAINAEYRWPLEPRTELVGFFDAGTSWLVPGWLGGAESDARVLRGTSGALRASTGLELRWEIPVLNQTLRVYAAANPLRLAQTILLPDGTPFLTGEKRLALGWALGTLF